MKKFLILLGILFLCINSVSAYSRIKTIDIPSPDFNTNLLNNGNLLSDGRILFGVHAIFDPKNNSWSKTKYFDDFEQAMYIVPLDNGEFLLLKSINFDPMSDMYFVVKKSIRNKRNESEKNYYKYQKLAQDIENSSIYKDKPYEGDKQKIFEQVFLPYIMSDDNLSKLYTDYIKKYENYKYGLIYNPKTDTIRKTSQRNIYEKLTRAVLIKNGEVLICYSDPYNIKISYEKYNPKTNKFKVVNNPNNYGLYSPMSLADGRVMFKNNVGNSFSFVFYNPIDDSFEEKVFNNYLMYPPIDIFEFQNGKIGALIVKRNNFKQEYLYTYNPQSNSFSEIGKLLVKRVDGKHLTLPNDNLLIYGGYDNNSGGFFAGSDLPAKAEIINLKNGKSSFINGDFNKYNLIMLNPKTAFAYSNAIKSYKYFIFE